MFSCMLNEYNKIKYKNDIIKLNLKNNIYKDLLSLVYSKSKLDKYLIDKYLDSKTLNINHIYIENIGKCTLDIQIEELNKLIKYPKLLKTLEKKYIFEQNLIKDFKKREADYLTALYFLNKNNIPYDNISKNEIIKLFKKNVNYS